MSSFRQRAISGIKWTTGATVIGILVRLGQTAYLAHLLKPEDFGLMVMLNAAIGLAQTFADMGIGGAIITRKDATQDQLSSLYWLSMGTGVILFLVLIAAIPWVVGFYHEPRLAQLTPWVASSFLIAPVGQQFQLLLQRDLKFDQLAQIEVLTALSGTIITVLGAHFGVGVFALVWGGLGSAAVRALTLVAYSWSTWLPGIRCRWHDVRSYLHFGLFQTGERFFNYISANVDYLLLGHFLGASQLGIYQLAYELSVQPLMKINPIFTKVAFPVFAAKRDDLLALRRGYLELLRLIAFVTLPLLIGLEVIAPQFISVVFGEQWLPAVPILRILLLLGVMKSLMNPSGTLLLVSERVSLSFYLNAVLATTNATVFWFVAPYGLVYIATAWVIICLLYFLATFRAIYVRSANLSLPDFLGAIAPPLLFSIPMAIVVALASGSTAGLFGPGTTQLTLLILIGLGAASYASVYYLLDRKYIQYLYSLARPAKEA